MVQSGGVGAALVEQFSRLGIGISSFASVGDKLDVSGTDLMLWWEADDTTELAVLYLESFGHPRGFARTARRIGARIPVLTVHAGRWVPGQRAAASHTAAAVSPLITRQALFDQAGIIATSSFGELLNAVVLMAAQPIPAGKAVAIVSNGGGASVLAADACAEAGLTVARTGAGTRDRLRGLLPPGSALDGPVVTTSAVGAEAFREALLIAAAEEGVGALIAVVVRRGLADLIPVLTAERLPVPIAAVVLGQPEAIRLLHGGDDGPAVPAYAYPEAAARALARAARYGAWRSRPAGAIPELGGLAVEEAQSIVESFIARMRGGGWLSATEADGLMRCYGIPMVEFRRVADTDAAVAAAADLGGHVVLKADVPGLLHKTRAGAVELDLHGPGEVRAAMGRLQTRFTGPSSAGREARGQPGSPLPGPGGLVQLEPVLLGHQEALRLGGHIEPVRSQQPGHPFRSPAGQHRRPVHPGIEGGRLDRVLAEGAEPLAQARAKRIRLDRQVAHRLVRGLDRRFAGDGPGHAMSMRRPAHHDQVGIGQNRLAHL